MNVKSKLEELIQRRRYATPEDIRQVFGDYHHALRWLALFLVGDEKLAEACIIDVCTIAETSSPDFHEWLVYWAVRATFRAAFQEKRSLVENLASLYEKEEPHHQEHPPLSAEQFRKLIKHSVYVHSRIDVVCRFVLVMRGLAKDSIDEVAAQLRISRHAAERAYCTGFDILVDVPEQLPSDLAVAAK
jgi:hypothetical protein